MSAPQSGQFMPIADAVNDAETLRLVAGELSWDDDLAYAVLTLVCESEIMQFCEYAPEWTYRRMAHSAFEAVPGLKGEADEVRG